MHSLKVVPNHLTPIHSDHHIITFYLSVSRVEVLIMCMILRKVITLNCALIYTCNKLMEIE